MLSITNTVLTVIDVQGNLAQAMHERQSLFENLRKLINGARILEVPMIVTEQIPEKLGSTRAEIAEFLPPGLRPLAKSSFSCCGEKSFREELAARKRNQILVTGIECHVCVYQTTLDLLGLGYEVHVVTDCVTSRTPENRLLGIERMKNEGAKLTSTEMVLFELLGAADGEKFREIIKVVK
jgi:nicotinamidase-related amidase